MEKKEKTKWWMSLIIQVLTAIMAALGGTALVMAAVCIAPQITQ